MCKLASGTYTLYGYGGFPITVAFDARLAGSVVLSVASQYYKWRTRIRVDAPIKGDPPREVFLVSTGGGGGSCGASSPDPGERWRIFASKLADGDLGIDSCSGLARRHPRDLPRGHLLAAPVRRRPGRRRRLTADYYDANLIASPSVRATARASLRRGRRRRSAMRSVVSNVATTTRTTLAIGGSAAIRARNPGRGSGGGSVQGQPRSGSEGQGQGGDGQGQGGTVTFELVLSHAELSSRMSRMAGARAAGLGRPLLRVVRGRDVEART